ncbi:DUF6705 family protein [Lacinutrix venerupis]|uniref:DUF6705 domain-containing protein n=1 Tax=Lacinutrix venerupis TaxID=1486034 RepID=A0AAC9LMU3_9FLAO|nr:DUF6705 family protein [Lacinutrix venerupis]APY01395.1 hypothetical protein BWR22_14150 [Lacinutrix venerupis]
MTNTLFTIITIFTLLSCKAQSPIISLEEPVPDEIENAYYKDTNNILDPFVGTWVLNDGTKYLKIVFEKKVMVNTGNYYEDLLIGEFQYKENNIELANTLPKLTDTSITNAYDYSIDGNYFKTNQTPFDNTSDNFRMSLVMVEPNGCVSDLDVRVTTVNGQEAIEIFKRGGIVTIEPGEAASPEPIIPGGFYFLIKQ